MELKSYFTQDTAGNAVQGATVYVYQPNTQTTVSGIVGKNGTPLSNPFTSGIDGLIQFKAPNGAYDIRVVFGARDYTIPVQFNDVSESVSDAEAAAASATASADKAEMYALAAVYSTTQPTASAALTIGADGATVVRATLVQPTTTITIGGTVAAGQSRQYTIILNQGVGARHVTWDPKIRWADGRVPTLSFDPNAEDVISVLRVGGLAFYYGFFNGGSFA